MVVGRSCRLPGAASVEELWANLVAGRSCVTRVPETRWSLAKHGHPRLKEPGKSYVWSAGVLDDLWGFDPGAFGISPREAEQMDPQQRLMLELTWEALEDAGLKRTDVAGREVGVFIGASSTEYQTLRNSDLSAGDGYTATGGALSIIANRISHAFDLRGPSFTVDTACSSSLVALHQAMEALRSGRIDTAVVGGVNLLLSPFGFVVFSQASMLSPNGRCRTFDAEADGYVRAEGGVVLVLRTRSEASKDESRIHGRLVASGVNSDGRTNGIALPSRVAQAALLTDVYREAGIAPSEIAFVEAHGTGTRVGDPIEAFTIGDVLGRERDVPLPIGSIKSNIGHLEPASGLAGVLKAMLALEHDLLPPSINFDEPNPDIPFGELKLEVCTAPLPLERRNGGRRFAGVNSFGFGGTNAHVVVADAPARNGRSRRYAGNSDLFAISAATRPALRNLARRYVERLSAATFEETREIVAAAAYRRDMLAERVIVEWSSPRDLVRKLERIADRDNEVAGATWGTVTEMGAPVAFVFSGNGSQWPGMGRGAYATNRRFRETFDEIDALFDGEFGWSITEALFAPDIEQRLSLTHIAQPLIFAIQIAIARALSSEGLEPAFCIGHSVGEIAAACVAGAVTLRDAVKIIHARSAHQEMVRDAGRMGVLVGSREDVDALCREVAAEFGQIEVAAENAPRIYSVAGTIEAVAAVGRLARKRRMAFRQLDLAYPFHCSLIDPVREPLLRDIGGLPSSPPRVALVSTVTGEEVGEDGLAADYWWHNVRDPVRFSSALERSAKLGARIFVEIGPRSVLLSNVTETLETTGLPFATLTVLDRREAPEERDPIRPAVLSAFANGAPVEIEKLFGPAPSRFVPLPIYPWERRQIHAPETSAAVGPMQGEPWHRLIGGRNTADGLQWTNLLDTMLLPDLADHEVGGQAILPGAAFMEMALAVARQWYGSDHAAVLELDILQPLALERGRTREVRLQLSAATSTLEILSRPRLSRAGWQLHAVARLTQGDEAPIAGALPPGPGEPFPTGEIYRAAERVGLRYGPAFRLLGRASRHGERGIFVELLPSTPHADYGLDPARLDACFHGLFALLGELGAERTGNAYVPVRFGHTRLARPGAVPDSALIEITRAGERSILADFTLFDEDGAPIAQLHDARFQGARIQRLNVLADKALVTRAVPLDGGALGEAGLAIDPAVLLAEAASAPAGLDEAQWLLEGWADAAGLALARRLAVDGLIAPDVLAHLEPTVARWLGHILNALAAAGFVETLEEGGWRLAASAKLPHPDLVLRAVADEHPGRSTELLLAGRVTALASGRGDLADASPAAPGTIDGFELGGSSARQSSAFLFSLLQRAGALRQPGWAPRLLQIGYGALSHALADAIGAGTFRLTILDVDRRRLERARLAIRAAEVTFAESVAALAPGGFDLLVSAEGLHRFRRTADLAELRTRLAPGAGVALVEPQPSLFRDIVLGLSPDWFEEGSSPETALSPLRSAEEWTREFELAGFEAVSAASAETGADEAILLAARTPASAAAEAAAGMKPVLIRFEGTPAGKALAERLDAELAHGGHDVRLAGRDAVGDGLGTAGILVYLASPVPADAGPREALRETILALKECGELCARTRSELWVVIPAGSGAASLSGPVASGLLAFARTLANENTGFPVRRICLQDEIAPELAVSVLSALLAIPQTETDLLIGPEGSRALRVLPLADLPSPMSDTAPARLERGAAGGLAGLTWVAAERPDPAAGEVEIEVEATGLNFRDVMWAMSLLPDDILEDGFAGPTLGLECAGRVSRVGPGVHDLAPGERVLAFAPSAFSTFARVPAPVVQRVPEGWSIEAAASVPVAFLTAYYGLVTLGRLRAGEWVLVHGAAGGVGLAAIQIARWLGATVVATAGSPEKRALLTSLGVEHVLNSRSTAFVDDIRAIRRGGVDLVLNSLSGEAMERGLATLKPFGRFVELGKRDYVANTQIGLRPFRRNLSYFGVDVDQLLSDRDRASDIFRDIMGLFETGDLKPLPYRVFPASETLDAFRLMQQSGHVGKIVLQPPSRPSGPVAPAPFAFAPDRTHLVTGGFGGFGLEAARWLADQGVRHLVLVGRSGARSPDAQEVVAELRERGVDLFEAASDVSDVRALRRLLDEVADRMPPLAGVLHGAMVLEDGLVSNLTGEALDRVLAPKVDGARNLHRLLGDAELDYFVMFSSITTFIGNPGQGAYVAANGYLEGLARERREAGRPGLALAWGAISDVGVLARQKGLAEALSKRVGVKAMPAREALDLMAQALAGATSDPAGAVIAVGSLDWGAARRLPALASPTFAALTRDGSVADVAERQSIDLKALLASKPVENVRKDVVDVIVEEIATVLRIPKQDVSTTKRLSEIGLDSLMAIELATALQDRFALDAPPTGSVGALTPAGLADHLIGVTQTGAPDEDVRVTQALNERHAGVAIDGDTMAPLVQAVTAHAKDLKGLMN